MPRRDDIKKLIAMGTIKAIPHKVLVEEEQGFYTRRNKKAYDEKPAVEKVQNTQLLVGKNDG